MDKKYNINNIVGITFMAGFTEYTVNRIVNDKEVEMTDLSNHYDAYNLECLLEHLNSGDWPVIKQVPCSQINNTYNIY